MKPVCLIQTLLMPLAFLTTLLVKESPVFAQIVPDNTLGVESSQVVPRDANSDLIEGGAARGANLFHSFQEFNVDEGRGTFFANPEGIGNIFSRVTGANPSNILGTLGVEGAANLFLINPNGIIFGNNATLDVQGSFTATTADAVTFGEGGLFSAVNPQDSVLTISVPLGLQLGSNSGNLINKGNLVTGENLTLDANKLDLQGQIVAGGNLTLSALDTVKIRDSLDNPFIGATRGNLLIRGNQAVDIFALSHPQSGLFSGQDLVLQSANPIGGDAHFWSGGNFTVEQLDGNLGDLSSPNDPVIRVQGDLILNNYIGSSLHILAGGSVIIPGTVVILDVDSVANTIAEDVTLSDETIVAIDGSVRPTLDIRAGIEPSLVGVANGFEQMGTADFPGGGEFFATPTSGDIAIGSIIIEPPNGQVLITNQYRPNDSLVSADILITGEGISRLDATFPITGIDARGFGGDGSSVTLDSRGSILLFEDASINSSSEIDASGDIKLLAVENILLNPLAEISAFSDGNQGGDISLTSGEEIELDTFAGVLTSNGGEIELQADLLSLGNIAQISSPVNNINDGGDIKLDISEKITINGGIIGTIVLADFTTSIQSQEFGDTGNITIETEELEIIGFATPVGELIAGGFSTGGDITSDVTGNSNAGNIEITASKVRLSNGAQIRASTFGTGDTGNITIKASDSVEVTGIILESDDPSKIATTVNDTASGNGNNLLIETNRLIVSDGAQIQAGAFGIGQGGSININADQSVEIFDTVVDENPTGFFAGPEGESATGRGGEININTIELSLLGEDSQISNEVDIDADGDAGNTSIEVESLIVGDGARISNGTLNTGKGGTLTINASESVDLFGTGGIGQGEEPGGLFTATFGFAEAGDLILNTNRLSIRDGSSITASTFGFAETGTSGSIVINASESIEVIGKSVGGGLSSNITSEVGRLFNITNSSSLASGENITISTKQLSLIDTAEISTQTLSKGNAGEIDVKANNLFLRENSLISTSSSEEGNAGNINLNLTNAFEADNSNVSTSSFQSSGGQIKIQATDIKLVNDSDIFTNVNSGLGGGGDITINTDSIIAFDDSDIFAFAADGQGGNITLNTPAFFAESFTLNSLTANPDSLDNNGNADVNATGAVSGAVDIPDVSFLQNALTELNNNNINTEQLLANSCVVPNQKQEGTFLITGRGGLAINPDDESISTFSTGDVQTVEKKETSYKWQSGDPILEPQGIYRLSDGRLVMSRECKSD